MEVSSIEGCEHEFSQAVIAEGLATSPRRLLFQMRRLFQSAELRGARVLEIGGGAGVSSLWAGANGAREVICLEPEADGSTRGVSQQFARMCRQLGLEETVKLHGVTIQDFAEDAQFDIILLNNSINHLDEESCIHLLESEDARGAYAQIFGKLAKLARPGALLIACDCSRHNVFHALGIKNVLASDIEWEKHQSPKTWAALLAKAGFTRPRVRWTSFTRLGRIGRWIMGNPIVAHLTISHFQLEMRRL